MTGLSGPVTFQRRRYAAKMIDTGNLVPGSKQPITDEAAREEYTKCEGKMQAAVEWFRKDCAASEARAGGRVTPAILDSVRVTLPGSTEPYRLEALATVGVRDGTTLIITVFEEQVKASSRSVCVYTNDKKSIKHIEGALYEAKIPNITPQRQDARTIKIPIPK